MHDLFTSWYPVMPANDVQPAPLAAAARNAQECSGIRSDCLWSIEGPIGRDRCLDDSDISFYARSERGAEMGNHEKQNRVTLTDLMSNWWSKHPVGPLAPLGWDAVADCEYQGEQGILVKNHITGVYAMYRSGGIRDLPQGEVIAALITLGER